MFCTLQTGFAADVPIDNTTSGGINGAITDASTNPGDTILLNPGNYTGTNNTGITINKNVTIKGNGPTDQITIDAEGQRRIFNIASNTEVTFINITFINGNTTANGGAIFNNFVNSSMTFINCTFINNTGTSGGAIASMSDLNVSNSIFTNNIGLVRGGAIHVDRAGAFLYLDNCDFNENIGNNGGALFINALQYGNISNCNFTNNAAFNATGGGAVYTALNAMLTEFFECNFINNDATNGGAFYLDGNSNIYKCNFTNNSVSSAAIRVTGSAAFYVSECNFNNHSLRVINSNSRDAIIENCVFKDNVPMESLILNNGNMVVSGNIIISNITQFYSNQGTMGVLNLTFIGNYTLITKIGSTITLYAILTDDMGNLVSGQNISFYLDGVLYENVTVIRGIAEINYTATTLGDIPVSGEYDGNGNFDILINNGLLRIIKINASSTIFAPENVTVGKKINITGVATDEDGNPLANIDLTVTVDGKIYTVTTDSNGRWSLPYIPTHTGNIEASISWAGNDTHNGFTNNANFNVAKRNIIVTITVTENPDGSVTVIANATYEDDGSPAAGYPVDFILDGKIIGTGVTDSNGIATLTIPANKISDGPHNLSCSNRRRQCQRCHCRY